MPISIWNGSAILPAQPSSEFQLKFGATLEQLDSDVEHVMCQT